jgi:hypothetical protein
MFPPAYANGSAIYQLTSRFAYSANCHGDWTGILSHSQLIGFERAKSLRYQFGLNFNFARTTVRHFNIRRPTSGFERGFLARKKNRKFNPPRLRIWGSDYEVVGFKSKTKCSVRVHVSLRAEFRQ